tara:strand:- start:58 stop:297 length:240 start_codon:yes stop_codon:yes gene_type:complete
LNQFIATQNSLMFENDIIGMAWSDRVSFEEIKKKTGVSEKEVIKIMRKSLKKKSYLLWRKRVRGRITKHRKLFKSKFLT